MAEGFDFGLFTEDLVKGIIREIEQKRDDFSKEQLQCLAIDIHPWSGFLNLCMLSTRPVVFAIAAFWSAESDSHFDRFITRKNGDRPNGKPVV